MKSYWIKRVKPVVAVDRLMKPVISALKTEAGGAQTWEQPRLQSRVVSLRAKNPWLGSGRTSVVEHAFLSPSLKSCLPFVRGDSAHRKVRGACGVCSLLTVWGPGTRLRLSGVASSLCCWALPRPSLTRLSKSLWVCEETWCSLPFPYVVKSVSLVFLFVVGIWTCCFWLGPVCPSLDNLVPNSGAATNWCQTLYKPNWHSTLQPRIPKL